MTKEKRTVSHQRLARTHGPLHAFQPCNDRPITWAVRDVKPTWLPTRAQQARVGTGARTRCCGENESVAADVLASCANCCISNTTTLSHSHHHHHYSLPTPPSLPLYHQPSLSPPPRRHLPLPFPLGFGGAATPVCLSPAPTPVLHTHQHQPAVVHQFLGAA